MRYLILILLWGGFASSGTAQFLGGSGDGVDASTTIQLNLDGVPSGIRPLYTGGDGDGFDTETGFSSLGNTEAEDLYAGGDGDGYDAGQGQLSLSGEDLSPLYTGGEGDGFDVFAGSQDLSGFSLSSIYGGGAGDGYDDVAAALSLNGQSAAGIYGGGDGDGYDVFAFSSPLGAMMLMLYGGGDGDGYDNSQAQLDLSGFDLTSIYGGGDGDGYDQTLFSGVVPLPLTLLRFDAFPEQEYVLLRWVTENEVDTDFFTIEKTREGRYFTEVGQEEAAGTSLPGEVLTYELKDYEPYQGISYYRLKTTDFDGSISLSHLVEVFFAEAQGDWDFLLYPNPNTGRHFTLDVDGVEAGDELVLEVFDAVGQLLLREPWVAFPQQNHRVDLAQRLTSGSYLIRLTHPSLGQQAKILIVGGE